MIDHGITIVISPLLALMSNQVAALQAADIAVATLNSNTLFADRTDILNDLCCGMKSLLVTIETTNLIRPQGHPRTRLLYITPEFTLTESFRRHLHTIYAQGELARIAIDEAHCISEWGHDFRPAYAHLSHFRQAYPTVPIICLTATATPSVRASIISNLSLNASTLRLFLTPIARPNLHYEIRYTSDSDPDARFHSLLTWLQAVHARRTTDPTRTRELAATRTRATAVSGIIYVPFRSDCDALAGRLRANSIGAMPYHAGLSARDRATCQRQWIANAPGHDIVVATTAFGMGIDKQDVRFVVHWSLPKSFEGYYQEAGRAGRDGKAATCIMFYSREERDRVAWRIAKDANAHGGGAGGDSERRRPNSNPVTAREAQARSRAASFQQLVAYCEDTSRCRHSTISHFFEDGGTAITGDEAMGRAMPDEGPVCDFACDFCKDAEDLRARKADGLATEEWVSTQRESREDYYGEGE